MHGLVRRHRDQHLDRDTFSMQYCSRMTG
jgi:hypothetical protein